MKRRLLLSGVHGVGKGHFLQTKVADEGRFEILSASALIQKYRQADDAGYKKVKDVYDNQQLLLYEFKLASDLIERDIILDGHLSIINASGEIESIPAVFFSEAAIDGILLLQEKSETIVERQARRDHLNLPINLISQIQNQELEYCQTLLEKYQIPFKVITAESTYQELCEFVDCL